VCCDAYSVVAMKIVVLLIILALLGSVGYLVFSNKDSQDYSHEDRKRLDSILEEVSP
jgi:hypothetical protein